MALLQAPVDKHPHGSCEPCQQQEIKELIGRVNLHVRVGNELLICLDECKVLSQRWQVGSHEGKPVKLPFLGTFLFNTSANRHLQFFALKCETPGWGRRSWLCHSCPCRWQHSCSRLWHGRGSGWSLGGSLWIPAFLILLPCAKQVWLLHGRYWVRPTCSEWGRDVLTPKCHFWGTPYKTWLVCVDTLNSLRHFLPPPGHYSRRICQVS